MRLKNRMAIVTGAGQGIGRAIALLFAQEGADITLVDQNLKQANEVADEIKCLDRKTLVVRADVSKASQVKEMFKKVMQDFERIDILVNSTWAYKQSPIENVTEEDWDLVMDINLKGTFLCCQNVGRQMINQKKGNIINSSSISAEAPQLFSGAYSPSKAGVVLLTKLLAMEWAKYNIRVNAIGHGPTVTPQTKKEYPKKEAIESRCKSIPLRRFARPEEMAKVALFLASDDSSYITGEHLIVDGGQLASIYYLIPEWGERAWPA